jgi:hypothetical protein
MSRKCSMMLCSHPAVAAVFFAKGDGMASYCKGHLTIARARSMRLDPGRWKIEREVAL